MLITDGGFVFTRVELLEVELAFGSFGRPQPEVVGCWSLKSRDRNIISDCVDYLAALPDCNVLAVFIPVSPSVHRHCFDRASILVSRDIAVELNVHSDIVPGKFPRVEVQPIIWYFYLESVDNLLLEDTISVTQAISPSRVIERGHAVKKTCSQPAKTAVTKSSVMLLRYDVFDSEAQVL